MKAIFWIGRSGLFGSLIRFFKHRGISHAEVLFSDGFSGTSDASLGGVVLYKLEPFNPLDWFVLDLPATLEQEIEVRRFFMEEAGAGYDWKGIFFSQLFRWNWASKNRWFCSEACTAALQRVYPQLLDLKPCQIDPAELAQILEDRIVKPAAIRAAVG